MIWADDDNPDTFRIQSWYEENDIEIVVYDNGSQQSLGGAQHRCPQVRSKQDKLERERRRNMWRSLSFGILP